MRLSNLSPHEVLATFVSFGEGSGNHDNALCRRAHYWSAIWKIRKDTEEIVYAMDSNHKKERYIASL